MNQIFNYSDFILYERININIDEIEDRLNQIRIDTSHTNKDYAYNELCEVFAEYWTEIEFKLDSTTSYADWLFPNLYITYFGMYPDLIIVYHSISFKEMFFRFMQNDKKWEKFVDDFCRSIGHELVHNEQYKRNKNKKFSISEHPDYEEKLGYYGNIYEISAYAWEIYNSLSKKMSRGDIIKFINNISSMKSNEIKKYSSELFLYYQFRDNKKIWNKLLQYIVDLCS